MSEENSKHTQENNDFETELLTERTKQPDENIPEDKGNAMYFVFFLYGFGILLPFNAVTTAFDFFIAKVSHLCSINIIIVDAWVSACKHISVCMQWSSRHHIGGIAHLWQEHFEHNSACPRFLHPGNHHDYLANTSESRRRFWLLVMLLGLDFLRNIYRSVPGYCISNGSCLPLQVYGRGYGRQWYCWHWLELL